MIPKYNAHKLIYHAMLCHGMLEGFALYLSKKVHHQIEIKPYDFSLPCRLIYHQDSALSSKYFQRNSFRRMYMGRFLGFGQVQYWVSNGICYFDSVAVARQIFLVLEIITDCLRIWIELQFMI